MVGWRTRLLAWTPVGGWMLLVFLLSAQSSDESAALSGAHLRVVATVIDALAQTVGEAGLSEAALAGLHTVIRKAAHVVAYVVLGVLTVHAVVVSAGDAPAAVGASPTRIGQWARSRPGPLAWLIATGYAASDELHQIFVPGRSGEFIDVLLDSLGAFVGVLGYLAWRDLRSRPVPRSGCTKCRSAPLLAPNHARTRREGH